MALSVVQIQVHNCSPFGQNVGMELDFTPVYIAAAIAGVLLFGVGMLIGRFVL